MRSLPPVDRVFDVLGPVVVYRPVGRRPSRVYVDASMNATLSSDAPHRLSDIVYQRMEARPGDQIQDCSGGMLLVTPAATCHQIRLAPPQPLDTQTAFRHAQIAAGADREVAERLVAEGKLAEVPKARRPKGPPTQPGGGDVALPEDHPLVIEKAG
ncbi:MAG TPA: hypothetical protein VK943_10280 [Arenibaculum sp.]|nr:hypothetical protein [Arenibaculum sp.]